MKKDDLRTGMLVEDGEERRWIVVITNYDKCQGALINSSITINLDNYSNDLISKFTYDSHNNYDITKVYSIKDEYTMSCFGTEGRKLLWERKEVKEEMIIIDGKEVSKSTVKEALKSFFENI